MLIQNTDKNTPQIMGILNTTPDSFSDGGHFNQLQKALQHARSMIADGADIIDIGGESTRPGAQEVTLAQELERTIPVIEKLRAESNIPISIDTTKPQVMSEAVAAGANIINDVKALQSPGAIEIAAKTNAQICLMHMQGTPQTMQNAPVYENIVEEITSFFEQRIAACVSGGVNPQKITLDPGFGFGKTLEHNYQILANLDCFSKLKRPILVGVSRKSMIGNVLNNSVSERLAGSLAAAIFAAQHGASVLRVHDVKETADAFAVLAKIAECSRLNER